MIYFKPMVINNINKIGIYFMDTKTHDYYVFYWNPIRAIKVLFKGDIYIGFLPFLSKHIKFN